MESAEGAAGYAAMTREIVRGKNAGECAVLVDDALDLMMNNRRVEDEGFAVW